MRIHLPHQSGEHRFTLCGQDRAKHTIITARDAAEERYWTGWICGNCLRRREARRAAGIAGGTP